MEYAQVVSRIQAMLQDTFPFELTMYGESQDPDMIWEVIEEDLEHQA